MYLPMGLIVLLAILFFSMLAVIVTFNSRINRREEEIVRNYYRITNTIADTGANFFDIYGKDSDQSKHIVRMARKVEWISRAHMEDYEVDMKSIKEQD